LTTARVGSFEKNPKAIKNTPHFKSNTIGFYAIQGSSVQSCLKDSKKDSIADFFKQVRAANTSFKARMVIVDNYSSPISEQVARPAQELGIHLVFLPPYSPDLNPIESLWKSVKRVLSTGFVETLDDMKQKIVSAWNAFSGQLSFAKHWIDVFLEGQSYYRNLRG
jgi:putative transposase